MRLSFTDDANNNETLVSLQTDIIYSVIRFSQNQYSVTEDEFVDIVLNVTHAPDDNIAIPHQLMHAYGNDTHYRIIPNLKFNVPQFGFKALQWSISFGAHDDDIYKPDKGNFGVFILKDDFQNPANTPLPKGFVLGDAENIDVPIIIAYVNIIEDELDPDANNVATGRPSISGAAQTGQTLTAGIGTITDDDGVPDPSHFTYQWIRVDGTDETEISGANSKSYSVTSTDEEKTLKVRIDFTDIVGYQESATSGETKTVVPETPGVPQNLTAEGGNALVDLS